MSHAPVLANCCDVSRPFVVAPACQKASPEVRDYGSVPCIHTVCSCRYIVHLSTLQAAATARADLQQAAQALADLSSLTAVSSSSTGVVPGTSSPRPDPSSSTADSGVQREQETSAVGEASATPTEADVDASEMKASRKPCALFLAYYNQVSEGDKTSTSLQRHACAAL